MSDDCFRVVHNGHAFPTADCPVVPIARFRQSVIDAVARGERLAALWAYPQGSDSMRLATVLARADEGSLAVAMTEVSDEYPSLTPDCPQAQGFEREIFEQWNLRPVGHPWLKPVRFPNSHPILTSGSCGAAVPAARAGETPAPHAITCGDAAFFQMEGDEVHEVAVGPVHAGIIEPGHFRFQCHGETVYHLEISLGYQHRGVERALVGGPTPRTIHYMETLAGDSTIGHASAYCRGIEALSKTFVPARGQFLRGIATEMERVTNHIGDLGALTDDVGFLPTMSYCGRIRGDVLNMTAVLCGNRFGRGMIRPGGVGFDIDAARIEELQQRLAAVSKDARGAIELLWESPSVMARFDGVGVVPREVCEELGMVGVAARACGIDRDVRLDFPYGIFRFAQMPVSTWHTGDVFSRAYVRWLEIQRSLAFVGEQLESLPDGPVRTEAGPLAAEQMSVALVEGWRGEICHVAVTGSDGRLAAYKVVDPSFHNWFGLAMALRGQQISDFPLCNKSFNLSYCGHDL